MTSTLPRTFCEAFQQTAARQAGLVALRTVGGTRSLLWSEYADRVRALAQGLTALGVRRGDTVALMLRNRPEFHLADTAVLHLGAIPFSLYNTSSPQQVAHLLTDSRARLVITEECFLPVLNPYVSALLVPDPDALTAFGARHGLDGKPGELCRHPAVLAAIETGLAAANSVLSRPEQVRAHTVITDTWQPGSDYVTHTRKTRRTPIHQHYATQIEAMYTHHTEHTATANAGTGTGTR